MRHSFETENSEDDIEGLSLEDEWWFFGLNSFYTLYSILKNLQMWKCDLSKFTESLARFNTSKLLNKGKPKVISMYVVLLNISFASHALSNNTC